MNEIVVLGWEGNLRKPTLVVAFGVMAAHATLASSVEAWTFPEHIRIGQATMEKLSNSPEPVATAHRALTTLWDQARQATTMGGRPYPLCESIEKDALYCVGIGSLVAIAADHSCSSDDLLVNLPMPWIIKVLLAADELQTLLDDASGIAGREDMRRRTHVMFQEVDKLYLARAEVNGTHFQLARESNSAFLPPSLNAYIEQSTRVRQEPNATALYIHFHLAALALARSARQVCAAGHKDECATTSLHTLSTESFALHFLEDSFSSGHFVGTWGEEDFRFGTHDAYSSRGIDAITWVGRSYAAYGDAFLSWPKRNKELNVKGAANPPVNLAITAEAVAASLQQVGATFNAPNDVFESALKEDLTLGRSFNVCQEKQVPAKLSEHLSHTGLHQLVRTVLELEPIPSARSPEAPRFRGEEGVFFGPGIIVEGGLAFQNRSSVLAHRPPLGPGFRFRAGFRIGFGLGGIATSDMEDQFLVDGGFVAEQFNNQPSTDSESFLGGYGRMRAPYVYLPVLEPLIVIPFAIAKNTWALSQLSRAANGGLWGTQRHHALGKSGRWSWQFSWFRDISFLTFYRRGLASDGSTTQDVWRHEFTSSLVTLKHRFPFAGADWAVSSDLILDFGFMIGWRNEDLDTKPRMFGGPNLSVAMGAKVFP